jgi:GNAT superfamily N-acetyltransferase
VASTWVHSSAGTGGRPIGQRPVARQLADLVDKIINRRDTRLVIAASSVDLDHVIGWLAHVHPSPVPCVHYAYVRSADRRRGIASRMLEHAGVARDRAAVWTCEGPSLAHLAARYPAAVHLPLTEFLA